MKTCVSGTIAKKSASSLFFAVMASFLSNCTDLREDAAWRAAIDVSLSHGNRLCTAPILMPDRTRNNARRKLFEELLARRGFWPVTQSLFYGVARRRCLDSLASVLAPSLLLES